MPLGILSDSHGRADVTARAVAALKQRDCELLIHLGDVGSHNVLDELIGHPSRVVFGNCDDEQDLGRYALAMHITVDHPIGLIDIDGKRIAFTHGHLTDLMQRALREGADYLLHGHSHEVRDERHGRTRIINPGALSRAARYTAAVLDPAVDALEIIEIPRA